MHRPRQVLYQNRREAGELLARALATYRRTNAIVVGIPRGGVPVAAQVARSLGAELDVAVACKIGAPGRPELAIGAVASSGVTYINADYLRELRVSKEYLQAAVDASRHKARTREDDLRAGRAAPELRGRTVILIDDGLATGATMVAALRSVRARQPKRLVCAVPVGARETYLRLRSEADEVVCLEMPEPLLAIGVHYADFRQVPDAEVRALLDENHLIHKDLDQPA